MWETFADFDILRLVIFVTAKIVLIDLNYLKVEIFKRYYLWNGESKRKMHGTAFKDFDICREMIPLRK